MKSFSRNVWIIIGIICLILLWSFLHIVLRSTAITEPIIIAHRGGAGLAPENTLAAVNASISRGESYIEVDVQRTSDDVLVLFHDNNLDRLTDRTGKLSDWNWKDLSTIDVGSHFDTEYSGVSIPTLAQVIEAIEGNNVTLLLEAKNPDKYPDIEKQINELLEISESTEKVVVVSFDHEWLQKFQEIAPTTRTGSICWWKSNFSQSSKSKTVIVFWAAIIADPTLIKRGHDSGFEVIAWTVNSPFLMKMLLWLGVDGIVSDYPDRGRQILTSMN